MSVIFFVCLFTFLKKNPKMNKLIVSILLLSITAVLSEFPNGVKRCKHGDHACFTQSTQEVLKTYSGGIKELNLLPFDPLHIKNLTLDRNTNSPVNIELKFKDLDVLGLKSAQIKHVKGVDFDGRSELEAVVPHLVLKGNYQANGRVLILHIVGSGDVEITCKNLVLKYAFDLKPVQRNNEIYAKLENVRLDIKPDLVQFHFKNLFNGDKALGDNINKFFNANWREVYQELEPIFAQALGLVTKQLLNNVLSKYPYKTFFA